MSLVSAHGIAKVYGTRPVLDGASITIERGDRVGLIGINGTGKSTLIRILIGLEEPDAGEIQRQRGLTVACIDQSPKLDLERTVLEHVKTGLERNQAIRKRLELVAKELSLAKDDQALSLLVDEQAHLNEALEHAGGWNIEHRAEAAMLALQVPEGSRKISDLSQGETRRVALCAGFLAQPDLLILDEPTNHIDVSAIEWLEANLTDYPGGLLVVTHDRYFLDRVANRHAELDRGTLRLYDGNYSEYLLARAEREALEAKVEHRRQRSIESELKWVRRRAPARTTKQKARLDRFDQLVAARPRRVDSEPRFSLPHPARIGKTILELRGLRKALGGKTLIDGFDLILKAGDRLGVVGPNGVGKTTLLRMITGELEPDAGEVVRGQNTRITYADQRRILDDDRSVLDEVSDDNDFVFVGDQAVPVHGFLSGLLFDSEAQRTKVGALSGGERSRVALAKALRVTANLVILDEPTNDLDLPTLRVLEDALIEYPGCALIVSHDRYFLDRVTTGILTFEGNGRVVLYEGGSAWRDPAAPPPEAPEIEPVKKAPAVPDAPKSKIELRLKRSFAEEREFEGIEARIMGAEERVTSLEAELSEPDAPRRLGPAMKERLFDLEATRKEVEALYARWEALAAIPARGGGGAPKP